MCRACADDDALALICRERLPDYLSRIYLFQGLSERQLEIVAVGSQTVRAQDGSWIYRQGDPARRFYLVREGQVALFRQSAEGKESIVALLAEDEMFAEDLLVVDEARHDLHAKAVGDCTLLSLDRLAFRPFFDESPQLCLRLMQTMHRRQQMLLDEIERLTLQDATQRVMAYLLGQVSGAPEPQRFRLSVPKSVLASRLAVQPETLSRILARLKECHYIREEEGSLVIPRPEELRAGLHCSCCSMRFWGCPGPEHQPEPTVESKRTHSVGW